MLQALLLASLAAAGGQKSALLVPSIAPAVPRMGAASIPSLPQLAIPAVPAIPALAPLPAIEAIKAQAPLAAGEQLDRAAQAASPRDRAPEPQAQQAVFDGGRAAEIAPEVFSAMPVRAQLAATGWYAGAPKLIPWSAATQGEGWLKFYRGLYAALAASGPKGYRVETPRGPVFHLGGHDVVQAALGVPRTYAAGEVNLYGRFASPAEMLELWNRVEVDAGPRGRVEVDVNPESTPSLGRMLARAGAADALDAVQNNILLKWNLVSLTPEGLELRGLDARAAEDLALRRLRLSTRRGPLTAYEAHYNLIVAYRALRETAKPWTFEPATRAFIAKSLSDMPVAELEEALALAAKSPALQGGFDAREGMRRLVSFIDREFGERAGGRARRVARDMPFEEGGGLEEGVPSALIAKAAPYRTQAQLDRIASAPPAPRARFAVIGDAEPGRFIWSRVLFNIPGVFERLLRQADADDVEFVVQLGDMVSRGTVKNYERFFGLLSAIKPLKPYLTVIGNHDRARPHGVSNARVYRSLFGRRTDYYFERGGVRFVALDTSAGRATRAQLDWLDEALDYEGPKILFTHMPPAYLGAWTDVPGLKGVGGFKAGAERLREIVERRKVARVYVGHIHAFGKLERNGVRYVLTGGGGSALFPTPIPDKFHHYLLVEAGPDGIRELVRLPGGETFPLEWDRS